MRLAQAALAFAWRVKALADERSLASNTGNLSGLFNNFELLHIKTCQEIILNKFLARYGAENRWR